MDYVTRHNYGSRSFTQRVKRYDRFKETRFDKELCINKKGGNKGNFIAKVQRTLAVGFCFALVATSIYGNAIAKQNDKPQTQDVPQQQDEEPNSTRDTFPREYISADMPTDFDPSVAEEKAFVDLMVNESGFEAGRVNKNSLACGVGQACPCTNLYPHATKAWILKNKIVKTMPDGTTRWYLPNPDKSYEVQWARDYIKNKYITAKAALYFWEVTSVKQTGKHWY